LVGNRNRDSIFELGRNFFSPGKKKKQHKPGLDFEHMIKVRTHKGGVRIGKTPKKLASICCP
jgi:hypothetical protein